MIKKLIPFLLLAGSMFGRSVLTGYCENGAQRVSFQGVQSTTYVQRSYPSCTVTVYTAGTTNLATIFSDLAGTAQANPFVANPTGFYTFWADGGNYDIVLSGGGLVTSVTTHASVGSADPGALLIANNLSDLNSTSTARTNLGLGTSATEDVGTTTGTVAAGDDSRFPTSGQKDALAGTSGTPSSTNKYVTNDDTSTSSSASKVVRAQASGLVAPGFLDYTGQYATSGQPGFLSASDWSTFNGKQGSGNYVTALTGDVTATGPGSVAATIAAGAVTNAKLDNMATQTIKGRNTAGTGTPEDLTTIPSGVQDNITRLGTIVAGSIPYSLVTGTPTQVNAESDGTTKGVVTFPSADFTCTSGLCDLNFTSGQKATGSQSGFLSSTDWTTFNGKQASGNYITGTTGDVVATGPGSVAATIQADAVTTTKIINNAVTLAKIQTIGTGEVLGRSTAGTGNVEELTTLPNGVQDNITRLGTVTTGAVPYSILTGVPNAPIITNLVCTGTATSSTTLYVKLYGSACTNTTNTIAGLTRLLVQRNGTIKNLRVLSGTAGTAANSGIVTIALASTGNTVVTCTVGTGTSCTDTTHSAAVTASDQIYVSVATQGTETLADVLIAFEY